MSAINEADMPAEIDSAQGMPNHYAGRTCRRIVGNGNATPERSETEVTNCAAYIDQVENTIARGRAAYASGDYAEGAEAAFAEARQRGSTITSNLSLDG